jgi:hypothetical protein
MSEAKKSAASSKIMTKEEIEKLVSKCKGTWVKRRNLRKRLTGASNKEVLESISALKEEIRKMKAAGAKERDLRQSYANVTRFEVMLIE